MSGTVGQNQVSAFTSPSNGDALDATTVKANDNATRTALNEHDADATIHVQSSVLASRPAAATAGRLWLTSDGLRMYYDTGSAWNELGYLPLAGGTLTGGLTISSGGVTITGTTNLNSGLNVTGATGFVGTVTIAQTLGVTGNVTLAGGLAHTGTTAGFFNKSAVTRPTVHSNIAGNDALALALFNALSDVVGGLGLVHDGGPV